MKSRSFRHARRYPEMRRTFRSPIECEGCRIKTQDIKELKRKLKLAIAASQPTVEPDTEKRAG